MRFLTLMSVLIGVASLTGCDSQNGRADGEKKTKKHGPAEVAHHVAEEELNTITLTEKARQRLGIQLAEVRLEKVQRRRTMGGEVVVPPGQTTIVSAPLAGTLSAPEGAALPLPGEVVKKGQRVFQFTPLLTPERDVLTPAERVRIAQTKANVATAQVEAERQVESAKVSVEAARIAYDRAAQLLRSRAGSQRSVDEAQANLKLAQEAQTTAVARSRLLSKIDLDEKPGQLTDLAIVCPATGILENLEAAPGETVAAGKPLFRVTNTDPVWVRVPIYVGHRRQIDVDKPAAIAEYHPQTTDANKAKATSARSARYVSAPPSANALATTVDLFYELANSEGQLYPGQRLAVTLLMRGEEKSLVIPWKAVLYDIHGGAWAYEQQATRVYARRRVAVKYVDGDGAVLSAGPAPGAKVVTDGAVELFGEEFGVGH